MSKFIDDLKRACDGAPAPIGFMPRPSTAAPCRMQLLALVAPEDLDRVAEFMDGVDAVLLPVNTEQVSSIMKIAYRKGIPVILRGAGTNLGGGSIPLRSGIVLSLTRMNLILELNEDDRYVVVCPESFGTQWKFRLQVVPVIPNPFR